MPKQDQSEMTAVAAYVKTHFTDAQIDALCRKMGINRKYQWRWYLNNPRRWQSAKAVAFAKYAGLELDECVTNLHLAYDELAGVL